MVYSVDHPVSLLHAPGGRFPPGEPAPAPPASVTLHSVADTESWLHQPLSSPPPPYHQPRWDHSMPLHPFLTSLLLMCLSPLAMTPPSYYHHHELRDTPLSLPGVTPPRSAHIGDQLSRHNIHLQQPSPPPPAQVSHTVVANIPGSLVFQHFERE